VARAATPGTDAPTSRRAERRLLQQDVGRSQLLDAAEEVFGRKGFHQATLKEVAELAEFSVGSVYSFFENKDDLFQQIFVRGGERFMDPMRDVLTSDRDPVHQLHDLLDFQIGWFRSNPRFARLYLREASTTLLSSERWIDEVMRERYVEAMALEADLFVRGQAAGVFCDGAPDVLARLFSGIVSAYQASDPIVMSDDPEAHEHLPLAELHRLVERTFVV
jgi:AcrR family transcriptional regulator